MNSGSVKIGSRATDDIKALDLSLGLTAGYAVRNGLVFSLRADWGLSNLRSESIEDGETLSKIYSSDFVIQIGYVFGSPKHHRRSHNEDEHMGKVW